LWEAFALTEHGDFEECKTSMTPMEFETSNDYDLYALGMLAFICSDCGAQVEPPDYDENLGAEYQYAIARRAESACWFISFDKHMTCYCPLCREKRKR